MASMGDVPRRTPLREQRFNEPNLSATDAIHQHIVPQHYLERFSEQGRLHVLDYETGQPFFSSAKNAGVNTKFYNFDVGGQELSTEQWLSEVESAGAPLLDRLVSKPSCITELTELEDVLLARHFAAQRFRVPAFRKSVDARMDQVLDQIKDIAKGLLKNLPADKAKKKWEQWESMPREWWFGENAPTQPADLTASMLAEVQGFANLLFGMPWRIGHTPADLSLYTSDNPVSAYTSPVRPWFTAGAFPEQTFVIALAPRVLLWISPLDDDVGLRNPRGKRIEKDFSAWEASIARHIIAADATRFLFGSASPIDRDCAESCLYRINTAKITDATRLQGYEHVPPPSMFARSVG